MLEFHILEMTFSYIAKILASLWNKVWFCIANFLNFVQIYLSDCTSSVSVMECNLSLFSSSSSISHFPIQHSRLFRVRFYLSLFSCAFSFFFFSYSVFVFSLQWKCLFIFPYTLFAKSSVCLWLEYGRADSAQIIRNFNFPIFY